MIQPINVALTSFIPEITPPLAGIPPHVTAVLEVDLDAIQHNFRFLQRHLSKSRCGAVIKANAYGLGLKSIAPTLTAVGCKDFFVATPEEALELRACLPLPEQAAIYVLNGLMPGTEHLYFENHFIPILNTLDQIVWWQNCARVWGQKLPAALNFDTGLNRIGLTFLDYERLRQEPERLEGLIIQFYMSHLACSDQQDHPLNEQQLQLFRTLLAYLPSAPASFVNSHGIFLGDHYHFDLARPGRALYGLEPRVTPEGESRLAVRMFAKVLQIYSVGAGQTIGYGATFTTPHPMRLATLGIGYADGLHRSFSNTGAVFLAGVKCPIVGRVSMDLTVIDVSHVPESALSLEMWGEIIGDSMPADEVASRAGTIAHELLVHLGPRLYRLYRGANAA